MNLQDIKEQFAKEQDARSWKHFEGREEVYWEIDELLQRAYEAGKKTGLEEGIKECNVWTGESEGDYEEGMTYAAQLIKDKLQSLKK